MQPIQHWTSLNEDGTVAGMNADGELVDAVLQGQRGAFERLVRAHQGLVAHIIARVIRNTDDVKELCQETFLRVYRQLRQFRQEGSLKAWIGQIAYSIALRHLERHRHHGESADVDVHDDDAYTHASTETDTEELHSRQQTTDRIRTALKALPMQQRVTVCLYHLDGLAIAEISDVTGMPAGTIKSALFRARQRLRNTLMQDDGSSHDA
jgi:RNA polymerase sigma-70 factor, ECF subfamily